VTLIGLIPIVTLPLFLIQASAFALLAAVSLMEIFCAPEGFAAFFVAIINGFLMVRKIIALVLIIIFFGRHLIFYCSSVETGILLPAILLTKNLICYTNAESFAGKD
jgi:hypothetical protein